MAADGEDDFVLTLSDGDGVVSDHGSDAASKPAATKAKGKRKRGSDRLDLVEGNLPTTAQAAKKTKKRHRQAANDDDGGGGDWGSRGEDDGVIDPEFEFIPGDGPLVTKEDYEIDMLGAVESLEGAGTGRRTLDIDDIVDRRRRREGQTADTSSAEDESGLNGHDAASDEVDDDADEFLAEDGFGMGVSASDGGDGPSEEDEEESRGSDAAAADDDDEEDGSIASPVPHPADVLSDGAESVESGGEDEHDAAEEARRAAFFAPEESALAGPGQADSSAGSHSFQQMSLSRPVLKGLNAVGFLEATPIQAKTIPVALLGKDVVGGAVTGSGKTAAFLVPIIERLLYRPKAVPSSRVAILMPTRELAVQCHEVARKLASFTDISMCRLVGGFSLREQENELRQRPDVIIATPGRFIDHMRNSASFTVESLEILVLDEADRMLEDGFADELNEILTTIPKSRQTMLFSATMTDSVDKLIRLGMSRPVRLMVDARKQTVATLVQEFVRLRAGREERRLACLMVLCSSFHTDRVIIFFRQKKEAHRVRVVFALAGLKAAELHGSMSQEQRLQSVESFRRGRVSFLLATDLASRGLDIKGVETVINYEAPQSHEIYLHRVGRTARAGRAGRACTLAADGDRKVVRAAVKAGRAQGAKMVSRLLPPGSVESWAQRLEGMRDEVEAVLAEEKDERQLAQAEMQVQRGTNLLKHEDEIMARPKRTWFESEREKRQAKLAGKLELNGPADGKGTGKGRAGKLSGKAKKRREDHEGRLEGRTWKKGSRERSQAVPTSKGSARSSKAKAKPKTGPKEGPKTNTKGASRGASKSRPAKTSRR